MLTCLLRAVAVTAAIIAFAVSPTSLLAAPPTVEHITESGTDMLVADCGAFMLTETFSQDLTIRTFVDDDGNPLRVQIHGNFEGVITNSATGQTFRDPGHYASTIDIEDNTDTVVGLFYNVIVPGVGPVVRDVGRVVLDVETGEVLIAAGPHDFFFAEDVEAMWCSAFGG